jgi:hypothetical protein
VTRLTVPTLLAITLLAGCSGEQGTPAPPHRIVEDTTRGLAHYITVEVDSTEDLRAIFDAVIAERTEDGGYFVSIDCSTGGTAKVANRLANGRAARGTKGAAVTGLKEGEVEFTTQSNRTCPA